MKRPISIPKGIFLLYTSMMGSGVIFIPMAFKSVGLLGGFALLFIISILVSLSLLVIGYGIKRTPESSLFEFCKEASPILGYLFDISVFILGIFVCLLVISLSSSWICILFNISKKYSLYLKIMISIPLFFTSSSKSIAKLKFISYISGLSAIYFIFLSSYIFFRTRGIGIKVSKIRLDFVSAGSRFIFSLYIHSNFVSTYNSLKDKNSVNIFLLSFCTIFLGGIFYGIVGVLGYFSIGNEDKSIDFLSAILDKKSTVNRICSDRIGRIVINLGVLFYILLLWSNYIFQAFPTRNSLLNLTNTFFKFRNFERNEKLYRIFFTGIISTISLIVSILDPNITFLFNLVSAILINLFCFIIPPVSYFIIQKRNTKIRSISLFLMIFGFFSMVFMVFKTFKNMFE